MVNNLEQKMRSVISDKELIKLLNLIIVDDGGSYIMFNRYHIIPEQKSWRIESTCVQEPLKFYTLKSATAYCIFHCAAQIRDSDTLRLLDMKITGHENNLEIYNQLLKKYPKSLQADIYAAKKSECEINIRLLKKQIAVYHDKSRDLQLRKFRAHQINTI